MILLLLAFSALSFSLLGQDTALEHARQVNLKLAAEMQDFVADETAKRYGGHVGSTNWRYGDTVESEITIKSAPGIDALRGRTLITRQNWRINGEPKSSRPLGFMPGAGFSAELKALFTPQCLTKIRFEGREKARGKDVLVYRFNAPQGGCFGSLFDGQQQYNAARTGRVLVDDPDGNVIQYEEEASGFPAGYGFVQRNELESWDSVKIGEASYWLPVAADFIWCKPSGQLKRVTAEYKNHRHFEATTNLTFGAPEKLRLKPEEKQLALSVPSLNGQNGVPPNQDKLGHMREVYLERAANMPNLVANETAKRYSGRTGSTKWRLQDTVESEIAFQGNRASRQHVRINGKPWSNPSLLPGTNWGMGFGTEIVPLFDPKCPNTIDFAGSEKAGGKHLMAYRFSSPPDGCFGAVTDGFKQYDPAVTGRVLVDDPEGNVVRLELTRNGFPAGFGLVESKEILSWDYVNIGDGSWLLPVAGDYVFTESSGEVVHIVVQYKHFEASTNVTFQ